VFLPERRYAPEEARGSCFFSYEEARARGEQRKVPPKKNNLSATAALARCTAF